MNWEPWTGCYPESSGCANCYFYGPNAKRYGQNTITKTDKFDWPIRKKKNGDYNIKGDKILATCFATDFFLPELLFATREDFRIWLCENATTSDGVWLIFGKVKTIVTLNANEALEEALCFGWIDGQMKSLDDTKYRKYFACRREKSPWSDKNKKIVETLRERNMMTDLGEKAYDKRQ